MKKNIYKKSIITIIFILIISCLFLFSSKYFDDRFNDLFTKIIINTVNHKAPQNVALVVIDKNSVNKIEWPWTKDLFSNIFEYFEKYTQAKAVVSFNLVSHPDTYNLDKDEIFYSKLPEQKKLINTYLFSNSGKTTDLLPLDYISLFDTKTDILIKDNRTKKITEPYYGISTLSKKFLENLNNLAFSLIPEDDDKIVRFYMPIAEFNKKLYPSIALSAYSMSRGIKSFVLYDNYLCSDDNCKTLKMPIYNLKKEDYFGNEIIGFYTPYNWYQPISEYYSHKAYSAYDIYESYNSIIEGKKPKINPEEFKDKIIIVGLNANDNLWNQLSETPVMKYHSDIDVHAVMIDNLMQNTFKQLHSNSFSILLLTIIFSIFVLRGYRKLKYNLIFASIFSLIYFLFYIYEFSKNIIVPSVTPIVIFYSCAFLKKIYEIIVIDDKIELIKRAMSKYVSKDVMKKVVSELGRINVGGNRENITILFVDIRNFTQISEDLSPQDVTLILNEYFSTIEPIIAKYHGIVNKYMGDGVLAIFGKPIYAEEHPLNAVKCGIEILKKVKVLREKFLNEGKPKIDIGIGINTGEVFVGNIGTEERLEYTVIGDNVNLAYRIESFNQLLKTQFLVSQYTYEYIKDYVEVVKLSQVYIKGKSKPIDIYEVLRLKNE